MIEGDRRDHRTEAHAARARRQHRERGPGLERRTLGLAPEAGEVIRAAERLVAHVLGGLDQAQPPLPGEPFLSLDHDADLHGLASSVRGDPGRSRALMYTPSAVRVP